MTRQEEQRRLWREPKERVRSRSLAKPRKKPQPKKVTTRRMTSSTRMVPGRSSRAACPAASSGDMVEIEVEDDEGTVPSGHEEPPPSPITLAEAQQLVFLDYEDRPPTRGYPERCQTA